MDLAINQGFWPIDINNLGSLKSQPTQSDSKKEYQAIIDPENVLFQLLFQECHKVADVFPGQIKRKDQADDGDIDYPHKRKTDACS
ncbi:hypothetical protein NQ019_04565 [Streptococcus suis]|nr:hypothetical protein [Streptococcus suis]